MSDPRPTYVTDTHSLLWWLTRPQKLRPAASAAFAEVEANAADLIVPIIVIAELVFIAESGRAEVDLDDALTRLQTKPNVYIQPLELPRVIALRTLTAIPEMHDRLIVAEALARQVRLITKDEAIVTSGVVATVW
jgi:PIN domain nuclease of toxin-antitoxin system